MYRVSLLQLCTYLLLAFVLHPIAVSAEGHRMIRLSIVDEDTKLAIPARIYLNSEVGAAYYFSVDHSLGSAVKYEKQNWINKQSIEYHTTVSAHPCFAKVPAGKYLLTIESGKSYRGFTRDIVVTENDIELVVPLKRWNDPAARKWYSGDTHLHRTIEELRNVVVAEDINVAFPLTHWVTRSDTAPTHGDKNNEDAQRSTLIEVDDTHLIWPRNTEYEIFTVGMKQHTLGALFVLGHQDGLTRTVPPWKPLVEEITSNDPNAFFDMDKLDWPFAMLLPTLAPRAVYELSNNHTWRTQFAFRSWNTPAPAFLQPPYGGASGGHREWLDYTHGMYYTLLNSGLRLAPSAGTANGVHPVPAGFGRVYVHLPDGFGFEAWMRELKKGRSFVTTGPMLYATADGHDPGEVFLRNASADTPISLQLEVESEMPLLYGEILINGRPEHLLYAKNERSAQGAFRTQLSQQIVPKRSGWFAIRFWENRPDGQVRFAHTAPWYVEVDAKPVAIVRQEKEYLIDRMQVEMTRSNGVVSPESFLEYRNGLKHFQALAVLGDVSEVETNSRPSEEQEVLNRWLDNMIIDHHYHASEVRLATGISQEKAESEIQLRKENLRGASKDKALSGVRVLPYPGGRHPRRGFLDGAINPQRETKISVFPPWDDGGYVVIDVPEAIFSNLGLIYLAHQHVPTLWDKQSILLPRLEWKEETDGLSLRRELPNGIVFATSVTKIPDGVEMKIDLTNGTDKTLTGLRVQVCTMLKAAVGFHVQEPLEAIVESPFIAVRGVQSDRWIVTSWTPCQRVWTNPPVPCIHSDPIFPDCEPGQVVSVHGTLRFYEGPDVRSLLK